MMQHQKSSKTSMHPRLGKLRTTKKKTGKKRQNIKDFNTRHYHANRIAI